VEAILDKPAVFVGSSTEGLQFARAVRSLLEGVGEVTLWDEDFFTLGNTFIDTLVDSAPRFDFAVLVLTPDDLVHSRGVDSFGPRDNVLFELGLFMGRLGRARTFVLYQSDANVKLPSDLAGLTVAAYSWPRSDKSAVRAVGTACDRIARVVRDLGPSEQRLSRELIDIRSRQADQKLQLDAIAFLLRTYIPWPEVGHLWGLYLDKPFPYTRSEWFDAELRRLRGMGVIEGRPGVSISTLPEQGDLKDYFHITETGRDYVAYRERFTGLGAEGAAQPTG
jgi:hypothetical protein